MKTISSSFAILACLASNATSFTMNSTPSGQRTTSSSSSLSMSTEAAVEGNPRKEGLALQLDDGTRKSHSVAQNSAFVTGFFKGLSNRDSYSKLLTSLYFVYVAMEDAFDATPEAMVKVMDNAELRRVEACSEDMEYFYGAGWKNKIQPSAAAKKYVARVNEVAKNKPRLLIAHQYTRYLGDLFGGQMMGGMATKSLDLTDGKGIAFYQFEIDSTSDFISTWYRKLNALDLTKEEKEEIVDEANLVFDLNIEILQELEGSPFQAIFSFAWKSFREKVGLD